MASETPLICPSCGSRATDLGEIPEGRSFAGVELETPLPGGHLLQCNDCHLLWRSPCPDKSVLDALYAAASGDYWSSDGSIRKDFDLAAQFLSKNVEPGGRVLDVGCFDGGLLSRLDTAIQRFGVEINSEARSRAQERGISILGSDLGDITELGREFDAVVAIDVIEHVHDPYRMLADMAAMVRPGGVVLVSTGNTDAWSWRLMRSRYWYCVVPEHISFINPRWCRAKASSLGLSVENCIRFSHGDPRLRVRAYELLVNSFYLVLPSLFEFARRLRHRRGPGRGHKNAAPPLWMSAWDHMFVVFRKRPGGDK